MQKYFDFNYICGDPFVEAGRRVLIQRAQKSQMSVDELSKTVQWALNYYVDKWNGKLHQLFTNGTITQPAFKGKEKGKTLEYFNEIFSHSKEEDNCQMCGRHGGLFPISRANMPLTGGYTNPNFHSCFSQGIMACKECTISLFFLPFAVMNAGKNLLLLSSTSEELYNHWLNETFHATVQSFKSEGIIQGKSKILHNQLYHLINNFSYLEKSVFEKHDLYFYYFTSFGSNAECNLIHIPKELVLFLKGVRKGIENMENDLKGLLLHNLFKKNPNYSEEWNQFIWQHYKIKNNKIVSDTDSGMYVDKKTGIKIGNEEIIQYYNPIIGRLINNKSILGYLRKGKVSSKLAGYYCMEVLRMDKQRIKTIIQLADRMAILIERQNALDTLVNLEKCRTASEFRLALVKGMRQYAKQGNDMPLFTIEEYLYKILPDGEPWTEARDLILVRLYENGSIRKYLSGSDHQDIQLSIDNSEEE